MPKCGVALTRNLARILRCTLLICPVSGAVGDLVRCRLLIWPKPCCDRHLIKHGFGDKAIWLGWSLGGLVASQIALTHPERVQALVTVASSPCFSARDEWPGIKPDVLAGFQQQLSDDFQRTVERFLALQTMGTETARQDARALKKTVLALPMPEVDVLNGGLEILKTVDLRLPLQNVSMPFLRLYGYLDGLVPRKVVPMLDKLWPHSESYIFAKAAHAPFISHPDEFCHLLVALKQRV